MKFPKIDQAVLPHLDQWGHLHVLPGTRTTGKKPMPSFTSLVGQPDPMWAETEPGMILRFWDLAAEVLRTHFHIQPVPWRVTLLGSMRSLVVSRVGTACKTHALPPQEFGDGFDPERFYNASPTKSFEDVLLLSSFFGDQIDAIAASLPDMEKGGAKDDFSKALDTHLDYALAYARIIAQDHHDLLPLPELATPTFYFQQPLDTAWLDLMGVNRRGLPRALKSAYLLDPQNGALLAGQAPDAVGAEPLQAWWEAIALTCSQNTGAPVGLTISSLNHVILIDPLPCGRALLVTAWYLSDSVPEVQKATYQMAIAIEKGFNS